MLVEIIGWGGNFFFVLSYFLVSQGQLKGDGWVFNSMNLVGAILFATYAWQKETTPVLVLELFWGSIAILALYRIYKVRSESA